jgi:hypothetical protein
MRYIIEVEDGWTDPSTPWRAEVLTTGMERRSGPLGTGWGSRPTAAALAAVEDWRESSDD